MVDKFLKSVQLLSNKLNSIINLQVYRKMICFFVTCFSIYLIKLYIAARDYHPLINSFAGPKPSFNSSFPLRLDTRYQQQFRLICPSFISDITNKL